MIQLSGEDIQLEIIEKVASLVRLSRHLSPDFLHFTPRIFFSSFESRFRTCPVPIALSVPGLPGPSHFGSIYERSIVVSAWYRARIFVLLSAPGTPDSDSEHP